MARKRDPRRDEALKIFIERKGEVSNRELASFLDIPEKTISAWKSRDKWNEVLQNENCSTSKSECRDAQLESLKNLSKRKVL